MNLDALKGNNASELLKRLSEAGYESYFVGGCVRDAIMEREAYDVDITTIALPQETEAVFAEHRIIKTGIKHGTIAVILDNEPVEITTFRTEGTYTDSRHPDSVQFVKNVAEDLARRDFTMNAIAVNYEGKVVDPFGGVDDISRKLIRAVGDPALRFQEDALRIMRAIRFAGQLGFSIDKATEDAMFHCADNLKDISKERIYDEFKKLVQSPFAGEAVSRYIRILGVIMPRFGKLDGFQQHNPHHKYDVLHHCIKCMQNMRVTDENRLYMKMAGLFHDIGKPDTFAYDEDGVGHCFGHPAVGAIHTEEILKYLKADRFTIDRVSTLIKYHDLIFRKDVKLLKKWLRKFGPEMVFEILEIKRADNLAIGCDVTSLIEMFDEVKIMIENIIASGECYSISQLAVNGKDIIQCCEVSGRDVGIILEELLTMVIAGDVTNEKAPLLEEAMLIKYGLTEE